MRHDREVEVSWYNPKKHSRFLKIDHWEVWYAPNYGAEYEQIGADISKVRGRTAYSIRDADSGGWGNQELAYEVRAYTASGRYAKVAATARERGWMGHR